LRSKPGVVAVEPDRYLSIKACFSVLEPTLVTWNVDKVGYADGTTKTAWILDTGVDLDHPDLNVDRTRSQSFNEGETSADDNNGHGTHIAGIIGAKNNSIGMLGVASGATIVGLKILDENGEGLLSVALKAIAYVKGNGRAGDAVNISMGLEDVSEILEREIKALSDKGIFVVIAAGNESRPANNFSPARTTGKNIYTITAVDSTNRFASFSNFGNDVVDFAAPGVKILSTYKDGKYAIMSGTSMAAPHVTGLLLINNGVVHTKGFATNDPDGTADPIAHR
ncbi:MAG TPA: S8 family serine peptidase, partial [Sphingobacteriaceae bacterium]